jgi:membrane protein
MVQLHCNPLKEAHISTIGQSKVRLGKLGKRLIKPIKEFIEDDMASYAAALSFWVFFSLFPFILLLVTLLSFLGIPGFFDWLVEQAQTVMPEQAMGQVEETVGQIRAGASGGLLSFVVIVALWPASAAVRMAMHALNVAYDVEEARAAWKRFSISIVYTILLAAMVIVAVGLMLVGPRVMEWLAEQAGLGPLFVMFWAWLRFPVAILLLMVFVALVYYMFPNINQPFRFITPGAILAVIVWLAASFGFSFYVSNYVNLNAIYGGLGAIIVLLLYIFISAAVLLFGAEVNAEIYQQFADGEDGREKTQKKLDQED